MNNYTHELPEFTFSIEDLNKLEMHHALTIKGVDVIKRPNGRFELLIMDLDEAYAVTHPEAVQDEDDQ